MPPPTSGGGGGASLDAPLYSGGEAFTYDHMARWPRVRRRYLRLISQRLPHCSDVLEVYHPVLKSLYDLQIEHWLDHVPREQHKIVLLEHLEADRTVILDGLADFLLIDRIDHDGVDHSLQKVPAYEMRPETRERLRAFMQPHVDRLVSMYKQGDEYGIDFLQWWRDFRTAEWDQKHAKELAAEKECVFDCVGEE